MKRPRIKVGSCSSLGFPSDSVVKTPPANAGGKSSILGLGIALGGVNCNSLQYACLGNPMDRGAWQVTVHGVTKESDTTEHTCVRSCTDTLQESSGQLEIASLG